MAVQGQQKAQDMQQRDQQPQQQYAGVLHDRQPGNKVHFCICCQTPIAVYGRLLPCMHAFCLTCATDMPKCFICFADIQKLERVAQQPLYISSATLQSFYTSDALARHTRQLYNHLQQNTNFGGGGAAQGATAVTAFP